MATLARLTRGQALVAMRQPANAKTDFISVLAATSSDDLLHDEAKAGLASLEKVTKQR
jgi:hypothetical protein